MSYTYLLTRVWSEVDEPWAVGLGRGEACAADHHRLPVLWTWIASI